MASALFGLVLSVGAIGVGWWALSQQLEQRSELEVHGKRELLLHILSEMPSIESVAQNTHRFEDLLIGHDDLHLTLVDPATGTVVASFSELARQSRLVLDTLPDSTAAVAWTADGKASLKALRGTGPVANRQPMRYYLSMDRRHDTGLLRGFVNATLLGLPVLLALVALGAWLIARTGLAPLVRFNRLAASIGTESLSHRWSASPSPNRRPVCCFRSATGALASPRTSSKKSSIASTASIRPGPGTMVAPASGGQLSGRSCLPMAAGCRRPAARQATRSSRWSFRPRRSQHPLDRGILARGRQVNRHRLPAAIGCFAVGIEGLPAPCRRPTSR